MYLYCVRQSKIWRLEWMSTKSLNVMSINTSISLFCLYMIHKCQTRSSDWYIVNYCNLNCKLYHFQCCEEEQVIWLLFYYLLLYFHWSINVSAQVRRYRFLLTTQQKMLSWSLVSVGGHADWAEVYLDGALSGRRCRNDTSLIIRCGATHTLVLLLYLLVTHFSSPFHTPTSTYKVNYWLLPIT